MARDWNTNNYIYEMEQGFRRIERRMEETTRLLTAINLFLLVFSVFKFINICLTALD